MPVYDSKTPEVRRLELELAMAKRGMRAMEDVMKAAAARQKKTEKLEGEK